MTQGAMQYYNASTDRVESLSGGNGAVNTNSRSLTSTSIYKGSHYTGAISRVAVPVGNISYIHIKAPPDRILVIEDALVSVRFPTTGDGQYNIETVAYVKSSNGNSWTHTPNQPMPGGRPLYSAFINNLSASLVDSGVAATITVDNPDYYLLLDDYFVDQNGSKDDIGSTRSKFFDSGRYIALAPSEELLVRTRTFGNFTQSADITTIFFTTEINPSEGFL